MSITDQLVHFCAPTLANIKTGSLFSCGQCKKCEVYAEVNKLNRILSGKGMRLIPIVTKKKNVLIYLYRVNSLEKDMNGEESFFQKFTKNC